MFYSYCQPRKILWLYYYLPFLLLISVQIVPIFTSIFDIVVRRSGILEINGISTHSIPSVPSIFTASMPVRTTLAVIIRRITTPIGVTLHHARCITIYVGFKFQRKIGRFLKRERSKAGEYSMVLRNRI